jgi:uncharacterized membrane protein YczE
MMTKRLIQLHLGLILYGVSMALMIRADLGLNPWDAFHQGLAARSGLSFGTIVILTGVAVLLLWIPLRQRPGIGTIANIIVIGLAVDVALPLVPQLDSLALRFLALGSGILLNGAACAAYIGAGLGPGPRDGLMTGLVGRSRWSVRSVRTGIEALVLAVGWLLGGTVGLGTLLYAGLIGPIVQSMLPHFRMPDHAPKGTLAAAE